MILRFPADESDRPQPLVTTFLITAWDSFATFEELPQFAFVRETWAGLAAPDIGVFIGLLIAGEATAGILVLFGGRWMRAGLVLFIGFHVGLLFFGWWLWLCAVPMLAALVLLLRAERHHRPAAKAVPTVMAGRAPSVPDRSRTPRPARRDPRLVPGLDLSRSCPRR